MSIFDNILDFVEENPGKSLAIVAGTVASGGLAMIAAPAIAATAGGIGLLGAASTGTAISSLSGAALTNASLAAIGGGALSAGGAGMTGGVTVITAAGATTGAIGSTAIANNLD